MLTSAVIERFGGKQVRGVKLAIARACNCSQPYVSQWGPYVPERQARRLNKFDPFLEFDELLYENGTPLNTNRKSKPANKKTTSPAKRSASA